MQLIKFKTITANNANIHNNCLEHVYCFYESFVTNEALILLLGLSRKFNLNFTTHYNCFEICQSTVLLLQRLDKSFRGSDNDYKPCLTKQRSGNLSHTRQQVIN